MDKIIIKGLRQFAYHGVNKEEKENGQHFELDITLYTSVAKAGQSDDLNDTVNYAQVRKTVSRVMTEASYDLIERAATRVAQQLLMDFPMAEQVDVMLKKPEAPMNADFDYVAVAITRARSDFDV